RTPLHRAFYFSCLPSADDCVSTISRNRTDDNILRTSTENILHNILHRSTESILHRSKDNTLHIRSKHVDRLDDKPGGRADGRVHNSTVHNLVELGSSRLSHSTVPRFWMELLLRRRQRWRELTRTFSSHHLLSSPSHIVR